MKILRLSEKGAKITVPSYQRRKEGQ